MRCNLIQLHRWLNYVLEHDLTKRNVKISTNAFHMKVNSRVAQKNPVY